MNVLLGDVGNYKPPRASFFSYTGRQSPGEVRSLAMGSDCLGPNSAISATYLQGYHERSLSFTSLDLIICTVGLMEVLCHRATVRNNCDMDCALLTVNTL